MLGTLYFLQEGEQGPVKIGWTSGKPALRLTAMQVGNSAVLRFLGTLPGPPDIEQGWHERFAHARKRSEWFFPTPELLEAIAAACAEDPPTPEVITAPATSQDVLDWVKASDMSLIEFAKKLNYTPAHVAYCLNSSFGVSPRMAYRIERLTGGVLRAEALLLPMREREAQREAEHAAWVAEQYANAGLKTVEAA